MGIFWCAIAKTTVSRCFKLRPLFIILSVRNPYFGHFVLLSLAGRFEEEMKESFYTTNPPKFIDFPRVFQNIMIYSCAFVMDICMRTINFGFIPKFDLSSRKQYCSSAQKMTMLILIVENKNTFIICISL